jgi:hypothetical protein
MSSTQRPSSVTEDSIKSLKIHEFIYHIMIQGTSLPQYLDKVTLSKSQEDFFTEKVIECARGTQYLFEDVNKSTTPVLCREIINNPTLNFVDNSKKLAEYFLVTHPNTASSGVLIITRVTMVVNTVAKSFIAILKVDYTKVLQQVRDKKNPNLMTFKEIVDSLSEDKNAIQKRVLVDVDKNFKWDVLAVEKGRVGQKQDTDSAITDYFKKFLSVKLRENDSVYSRKIPGVVFNWAKTEPDVNPGDARAVAVALIKANNGQQISIDDICSSVCAHSDKAKNKELNSSFKKYIKRAEVELDGVHFIARENSIAASDKKSKLTTNHNVTITFEGTLKDKQITIENMASGQQKITILADNVKFES